MEPLKYDILPAPTTLSGWLRAAVEDAQRFERTPGFELRMDTWNDWKWTEDHSAHVCAVCLAGAALVGRGIRKPGTGLPIYFGRDNRKSEVWFTTRALDQLRAGDVVRAILMWVTGDLDASMDVGDMPPLRELPSAYLVYRSYVGNETARADWDLYLKLADELEQEGL